MSEKTFTVSIPEGYEIDQENSTPFSIVFKKEIKPIRAMKWEDTENITGFYINNTSVLSGKLVTTATEDNRNIWPTRELAEASLALCQLVRLRDNWRDGWVPDYNCGNSKHHIEINGNDLLLTIHYYNQSILSFESVEIAHAFLEQFHNLITTAKPLL